MHRDHESSNQTATAKKKKMEKKIKEIFGSRANLWGTQDTCRPGPANTLIATQLT